MLNDYIKIKYGKKLYKISLNGGMSCPNRDKSVGSGGCIFCSDDGSGSFAQSKSFSITEQIDKGIALISNKYSGNSFIAYFQSFTNTYAPIDYLEKIFTEAISDERIKILSIATRPDCISNDCLALLNKLNKIKPVWIELGLQTSNENTARLINRCYKNEVFSDSVARLNSFGIETIIHMIIGLPGESIEDMINTVHFINRHPVNGVKLQLLHVLKNTYLEKIYTNKLFDVLSLDEYIDILFRLIEELRSDIVIHRLTGDAPKKLLVAPLWSANKKLVLNTINKNLRERNIIQGCRYQP